MGWTSSASTLRAPGADAGRRARPTRFRPTYPRCASKADVGAAHAPLAADLEVQVVVVGLGAVELELAVAGEGCDGGEELLAGAADLGVGEGHLAPHAMTLQRALGGGRARGGTRSRRR